MRNSKLTKYIPVDNNINKAVAFANTLAVSNIRNVQRIKTKEFYIPTLEVVEKKLEEVEQEYTANVEDPVQEVKPTTKKKVVKDA